jgi:hypothetical protein
MKKLPLIAFCLLSSLILSAGLSGCASMGASNTVSLLSAAGFSMKQPENAKQQEIYNKLTPYKMETGMVNGKRLYGYKDEKKGVVYVGEETEYQAYKRLLVQQNIAADNMMAAQMDAMTMQRYSVFSPYGYYRR